MKNPRSPRMKAKNKKDKNNKSSMIVSTKKKKSNLQFRKVYEENSLRNP